MVNFDRYNIVRYIGHRYGTYDPFAVAQKLNVPIRWCNLGSNLMGKVAYFGDSPIIMLNDSLQDTNKQYFICAHELGHVIKHEGLDGYYLQKPIWHDNLEYEATDFGINLLINLYKEEYGRLPDTRGDLMTCYGIPEQ